MCSTRVMALILKYDLTGDAAAEYAGVIGEVDRNNLDWKTRAIGQGYGGRRVIAHDYGVNV